MNKQIAKWYEKKHKCEKIEATKRVQELSKTHHNLFGHWKQDISSFKTELTGKSGMMGDYQVRFYERVSLILALLDHP